MTSTRGLAASARLARGYAGLVGSVWQRTESGGARRGGRYRALPVRRFHGRGQQAIGFALYHPVALAAPLFQTWPVDDRNVAAAIAYEAGQLQLYCGFRHTLAAHP